MSETRLDLLKRLNYLSNNHCETCPERSKPHTACIGCEVYKEFREIGDQLTEEVKKRRIDKQVHDVKNEEKETSGFANVEKFIITNYEKMTVNKMARKLNVSPDLVVNRLKRLGLERFYEPKNIYVYIHRGKEVTRGSIKEIAEITNIKETTLYRWLYRKAKNDEVKRIGVSSNE